MKEMAANPLIKGFTTNPTLMRKAGIADYRAFARDVLGAIPDRPVSFEVFADDFGEMESQALEIAHRAYVLETGSIVQTGTGKELLSSPDVQRAYLGM